MNPEQKREDIESPAPERKPGERIVAYGDEYKNGVARLYEGLRGEYERGEIFDSPDIEKIPENFWVALDENNEVVGTAGLNQCENRIGYINKMFVKKESRKREIGKELLSTSVEFARQEGDKIIFLATMPGNKKAQKFYTKNGFKEVKAPPSNQYVFNEGTVFFQLDLDEKPEIKSEQ